MDVDVSFTDDLKLSFSNETSKTLKLGTLIRISSILFFDSDMKTDEEKKNSINEVLEKISNLEYLIAMRFHANVVGIKADVKTLAINYDTKVEKLANEYNIPLLNLDLSNLSEAFDRLIK